MGCIVLEGVTNRFGANVVVDDLNLTINDGKFATLLGPSGCGKTTTLRMLAGFSQPDAGTIRVDGQVYPPRGSPFRRSSDRWGWFSNITPSGPT